MHNQKFLDSTDVAKRLSLKSRTTFWRWRKKGLIPPPDVIVCNRPRWLESSIEAAMARLVEGGSDV